MEKFCGEIGGNENPSRIVLEVELPEQARYNEEIADQCKTLFIRIVRRFYAAASVKGSKRTMAERISSFVFDSLHVRDPAAA
jgi:hypothetical protein